MQFFICKKKKLDTTNKSWFNEIMGKESIQVDIDKSLKDKLKYAIAKHNIENPDNKTSISDIVRSAINKFIDQQKINIKKGLIESTDQVIRSFNPAQRYANTF